MDVGPTFYAWNLVDNTGKIVASSGRGIVEPIPLYPPYHPVVLQRDQPQVLSVQQVVVAGLFQAPIVPGTYTLQWSGYGVSLTAKIPFGRGRTEIDDPVTSPVYPLQTGNSWTFKKTISFQTYYAVDTVVETIIGEELVNGEKMFLLVSPEVAEVVLTARADGIYRYFPDHHTATLLYKYPAAAGDGFTSGYDMGDTLVPFQISVPSANTAITTPSGDFSCVEYDFHELVSSLGIVPSETHFLCSVGPAQYITNNLVHSLISVKINGVTSTKVQGFGARKRASTFR